MYHTYTNEKLSLDTYQKHWRSNVTLLFTTIFRKAECDLEEKSKVRIELEMYYRENSTHR